MEAQFLLIIIFVFVFGAIIGSFLNVVIYRLPIMLEREWVHGSIEFLASKGFCVSGKGEEWSSSNLSLIRPASSCMNCHIKLKITQNMPIVSYLLQKGRCGSCGHKISKTYPIVEALTGVVFALAIIVFGLSIKAIAFMLLCSFLITLSVIDLKHQKLYDCLTLPLLWIGILVNTQGIFIDIYSSILGVVIGYSSLWIVKQTYFLIRKEEGLGSGDLKLLAALGAWVGWQVLPILILIASVFGLIFGLAQGLRCARQKLAFGSYLSFACWLLIVDGRILGKLNQLNIF